MRIGIIGVGRIGATIARLLARAGHQVNLSNSREPDSLVHLSHELGEGARAVPVAIAAHCSDVIFLAMDQASNSAGQVLVCRQDSGGCYESVFRTVRSS